MSKKHIPEGPYTIPTDSVHEYRDGSTWVVTVFANNAPSGEKIVFEARNPDRKVARNLAKLASAAPDMLEVLKTILTRFDLEPVEAVFPCSAMRKDIRAAIALAGGGE